jgi:hypothetical protein
LCSLEHKLMHTLYIIYILDHISLIILYNDYE